MTTKAPERGTEVSEYQQVAALICMDIDVAVMAAINNPIMAIEFLEDLKTRKDKLINDAEYRNMRYSASVSLFKGIRPPADAQPKPAPEV